MQSIIHKSESRGHADHGWLDSRHSFSFANYHDPKKMGFGLLRVLNDDRVAGGRGFRMHAHDNMEIISIPLSGALEHRDDLGNRAVIRTNDVQIMSAGTGVSHSEYNHHANDEVNFLQLWIFPKELDITPRYHQMTFSPSDREDNWQMIVSPVPGKGVLINQDAYLSMARLNHQVTLNYKLHQNGNGVYIFLLSGSAKAGNDLLMERDATGIWETPEVTFTAASDCELLLIEVPMA